MPNPSSAELAAQALGRPDDPAAVGDGSVIAVLKWMRDHGGAGGGLTDAELRASPVPVSGPLTDAQLRAAAVAISAAALPLPAGAATQATLVSILAELDVALSTRASQATVAGVLGQLDVALSSRATEATLALIKAKTDNLDVALSTRAAAGGLVQAITDYTQGDAITLGGGSSATLPIVGPVVPGLVVLSWRPPPDKILIVDDAQFLSQVADESFCRIGKRHFLYGRNNVAAPVAPAVPAVSVVASAVGMDIGAYTYKVAAVNAIGQEGPASVASATATTTAASRRVNVTPGVLPTGGVGWAIYRSLAGQPAGPWYWLVHTRYWATAFADVNPDSAIDTSLLPSNTWAIADAPASALDVCGGGAGEVQLETLIAMSAAPANMIYREARGRWRATPLSPGLAVGRTRSQLYGAGDSFAAATLATMFQRGSQFAQGDRTYDFNVAQVAGFDGTGTGGAFVVWGLHPYAASELAAAGIASLYPFAGFKRPLIVGPNAELYAEIGNTAAAASGMRQVMINGRLVPIGAI